jgi:DNA-binding NarL/FixJ family response regulator
MNEGRLRSDDLVCADEMKVVPEARLTAREGQVVSRYRLGVEPKVIAYELGLAAATVRVLLGRAAKRLGVRRPRDLRKSQENN